MSATDEDIERVRMMLAEAGFPDAIVGRNDEGRPTLFPPYTQEMVEASLKAYHIVMGDDRPCIGCFEMALGPECRRGDCLFEEVS